MLNKRGNFEKGLNLVAEFISSLTDDSRLFKSKGEGSNGNKTVDNERRRVNNGGRKAEPGATDLCRACSCRAVPRRRRAYGESLGVLDLGSLPYRFFSLSQVFAASKVEEKEATVDGGACRRAYGGLKI